MFGDQALDGIPAEHAAPRAGEDGIARLPLPLPEPRGQHGGGLPAQRRAPLLPAFPGAHAIKDAWDAKVKETGVTVHFVDCGVDTGTIILQRKVPVLPQDTLETLETRVHSVEYEIYPEALKLVLSGKVAVPSLKG